MKKPLLVSLLFLVTLGIALWALGVFDRLSPTPDTPAVTPGSPTTGPTGLTPSGEPKDEPEPDFPPLPTEVRVLVLRGHPRSFTSWLFQALGEPAAPPLAGSYSGAVPGASPRTTRRCPPSRRRRRPPTSRARRCS
jgi:hypothetical protein